MLATLAGVSVYNKKAPPIWLPRFTMPRQTWPRFHEELFPRVQGILLISQSYPTQVAPKVIYNKLREGIDQFEASIFGDFTRMKTVQFCGGFVHHLLLRQLYNDDPHVIEFEFNGVGARFDRKAFAMFTGLNCGKFPKETEMRNLSYSLWTKYFGESGPMTQTEFSQAFKNIEFKYDNDQEIWDNVKCCMFFFLETVLLPADRSRLVKKNNFTIIENDNLLEKYPWGNLCYDLTISSLRSKMEAGKHKTSYSLYGFPLAFQYIVNNELIPTEEELQKTYMINFWSERSEPVYTTRASTQSQPEGAHSQYLEGMINELREDFANMRADFGLQLAQQGSDIRELKTMVGQLLQHHKQQQIVAYTPPPPSPASEQEPHYPIHVVWDPFKPVDKKKKAALSKFLKDRKSKLSTVDGFDKISKEVYNIFLASGGWLNNDGMDVVLYFIRKRIDSNSGLFPSNVIITDCFFWASMQGRYNKHVVRDPHVDEDMDQFEQNIDWASEMNDTPFSDYYAGKMPLGSSSWAHKDIVTKVDIRSRHITLYDSAIKMTPKSWFQIKNARPLAVLFPYLLMVNEYYTHHPDQTLDLTPFECRRGFLTPTANKRW
ncbi:hypothetical protein FNV43_RR13434 [Rhamnella rubrinervis]|uniref:DUF1985 domain-containing protein n=1 Tax=Rhamnella rubrinervis TaxID=2594499 RepID=A0A8K0H129_9ROSA|nr:hypothetical protein FNV43_RR13434 [Rhamnella rubrinervis]